MTNPLRGEVEVTVDDVRLTLAATMEGLARLSAAVGHPSFEDLYQRLAGTEAATAMAALRHFAVAGSIAGKEVRAAEAADAAISQLSITSLVSLRGPFVVLLESLLAPAPKESNLGNG